MLSTRRQCSLLRYQGESMYLNELDQYDSITIQAHDNPDADAIASGYALYVYFQAKGKKCFVDLQWEISDTEDQSEINDR